jgi:hypothetical protein
MYSGKIAVPPGGGGKVLNNSITKTKIVLAKLLL